MASIDISGFGDNEANGTYVENGTHDGKPFYLKSSGDYVLIYKLENGPYSFYPSYWLEKVVRQFSNPKYKSIDENVFSAVWESTVDDTTNESDTGSIITNDKLWGDLKSDGSNPQTWASLKEGEPSAKTWSQLKE